MGKLFNCHLFKKIDMTWTIFVIGHIMFSKKFEACQKAVAFQNKSTNVMESRTGKLN